MKPVEGNLKTIEFVNRLNVALIALSLFFAFIFPIELFLLAYAVLGPLHYLTEINWLQRRKFFLKSNFDIGVLLFFSVLILLIFLAGFLNWKWGKMDFIPGFSAILLFGAFVFGLIALFLKNVWQKLLLLGVVLIAGVFLGLGKNSIFVLLFASLLPTMIHVLVFTFLFMLGGAMKSRSFSGWMGVLAMILGVVSCFVIKVEGGSIMGRELPIVFSGIFSAMAEVFGQGAGMLMKADFNYDLFWSISRLIAFSYTYHYLNWFSKTDIIGWRESSSKRKRVILFLWLASVGIYLYDYQLGVAVLFLLSMGHVILEFPLNHLSFKMFFSR